MSRSEMRPFRSPPRPTHRSSARSRARFSHRSRRRDVRAGPRYRRRSGRRSPGSARRRRPRRWNAGTKTRPASPGRFGSTGPDPMNAQPLPRLQFQVQRVGHDELQRQRLQQRPRRAPSRVPAGRPDSAATGAHPATRGSAATAAEANRPTNSLVSRLSATEAASVPSYLADRRDHRELRGGGPPPRDRPRPATAGVVIAGRPNRPSAAAASSSASTRRSMRATPRRPPRRAPSR